MRLGLGRVGRLRGIAGGRELVYQGVLLVLNRLLRLGDVIVRPRYKPLFLGAVITVPDSEYALAPAED